MPITENAGRALRLCRTVRYSSTNLRTCLFVWGRAIFEIWK